MKLDPKVVCDKAFKIMQLVIHLDPRSRSQGDLEILKNWTFADISDTINSRVMKLDPKALYDNTFINMEVRMTLTQRSRSQERSNVLLTREPYWLCHFFYFFSVVAVCGGRIWTFSHHLQVLRGTARCLFVFFFFFNPPKKKFEFFFWFFFFENGEKNLGSPGLE